MITMGEDGSTSWTEYAVARPSGGAIGPMPRTEAVRVAGEIGGTLMERRITHGPWTEAVARV